MNGANFSLLKWLFQSSLNKESLRSFSARGFSKTEKNLPKVNKNGYYSTMKIKNENEKWTLWHSKVFFPFFKNHVRLMKSFHHFKLRYQWSCPDVWGGELLLPFFPFCVLESELINSKNLFFTNLFCTNITVKTPSNSTKQI